MRKHSRILLYASYAAFILGLLIFSKGLLTSKPISDTKSSHNSTFMQYPFHVAKRNGGKKFVILVIDALRIDFALPTKESVATYKYANHMSSFLDISKQYPSSSILMKFMADPPTATTQRLGGITAGTLPSFVEAFYSFSGETFMADNFVYQLLEDEGFRKMHFLGDDTWLHLYPFILDKSRGEIKGFHSFHLFDLHTVDNGIKERLFPLIELNDFNIIIAHFLGLDHCGHKFGPSHNSCGLKLEELDAVIVKVAESIDEDTDLIVFGDHGMTDEGDHGGNTAKETSTVLFYYSRQRRILSADDSLYFRGLFGKLQAIRERNLSANSFYSQEFDDSLLSGSFAQIDFTPTFSFLAGIPIPFGNLGAIIPELIVGQNQGVVDNLKCLINSLYSNSHQVLDYFRTLRNFEDEFSPFLGLVREADFLVEKIKSSESVDLPDFEKPIFLYYEFLQKGITHCRSIWAKYDYKRMLIGMTLMLFGFACVMYLVVSNSATIVETSTLFLCATFLLIQCVGKFTNSFIIFEDEVVTFLLISSLFSCIFFERDSSNVILLCFLSRFCSSFSACREEHGKLCSSLSHRNVHPFSWQGSLVLCALALCFTASFDFKNLLKSAIHLILTIYQLFQWFLEQKLIFGNSSKTGEFCLMIISRCILLCSGLLFAFGVIKRNRSLQFMSLTSILAVVQRPFGGGLVSNVAGLFVSTIGALKVSALKRSLIAYFFGMSLFFWTGHHAVISNIHWEAGFTGFSELNQIRAALLLSLNTFAGPILAVITSKDFGDFFSFELLAIFLTEMLFQSISITFLLRHLMIWTVFTPRFIMQICIVLLGFTFAIFFDLSYELL